MGFIGTFCPFVSVFAQNLLIFLQLSASSRFPKNISKMFHTGKKQQVSQSGPVVVKK